MRLQRIDGHLRFPYIHDLENPAVSENVSFIQNLYFHIFLGELHYSFLPNWP
jgi:hypothetical protein